MARESALWRWLGEARHFIGDDLHIQRIENSLGAGTPDVEGFLELEQFWLELKSQERPARLTTPIRFKLRNREAQIEFMRRRWELGGNAFFLLQVGSGHSRRLYLAPGRAGDALRAGLTETELFLLCESYGVFASALHSHRPISQRAILKRVIECRNPLSPTPR